MSQSVVLTPDQIKALALDLDGLKRFADVNPELAAVIRQKFAVPLASPTVQDAAIAQNTTVNGFVATLRTVDPKMAEQIEGKSALGSRTMYIVPATAIVSWVATNFLVPRGFNLDPATLNLISGLLALGITTLVALVMRLVSSAPITSVLPKSAATPPDVVGTPAPLPMQRTFP